MYSLQEITDSDFKSADFNNLRLLHQIPHQMSSTEIKV